MNDVAIALARLLHDRYASLNALSGTLIPAVFGQSFSGTVATFTTTANAKAMYTKNSTVINKLRYTQLATLDANCG